MKDVWEPNRERKIKSEKKPVKRKLMSVENTMQEQNAITK